MLRTPSRELVMRIQSVLWELEGDRDDEPNPGPAAQRTGAGGGALAAALQKIQQVERTKLRVREAERAAKRVDQELASQLHPVLALVYADLSTAEFEAKDALQKNHVHLIPELVDRGYERARGRSHQILKDKWRELQSASEQPRPHLK